MSNRVLDKDEVLVQLGPFGEGMLERVVQKDALRSMRTPRELLDYMVQVQPLQGREQIIYNGISAELGASGRVDMTQRVGGNGLPIKYMPTTMDVIAKTSEPHVSIAVVGSHKVGYQY